MSKWTPTPIKKIGRVVTGKTPPTNNPANYGEGYMFVTPVDLHDNFIVEEAAKSITEQGLSTVKTNSLSGFSILVGCIGWDMGNVALVDRPCATNQQINSITDIDEDTYNPYYVYYWLTLQKQMLFQIANVTRTPILNKTTFEDVRVPVPAKQIQDGIVSTILPISHKIALNSRINAELERTARMIYEYMFLQNERSDWHKDRLGNITNIVLGGTPNTKSDEYWGGDINWLNSGEVNNFPVVQTELSVTQSGLDNSATKLMPLGTTVVSITGNIRASILGIDTCANQSVVGIYETETLKHCYLYPVICDLLKKYEVVSTGNCQTHINKGTIEDTEIIIPDDDTLWQYYKQVEAMYRLIIKNALQNKVLAEQRGFLLPLLMNGQVRVEA